MTGLTSTLNASLIVAALSVGVGAPALTQAGQAPASSAAVSEEQVQEAVAGISQAKGYNELVAALGQYKSVLGSQRARALVDDRMRTVAPDNPNGRKLLQILGQLFTDTSKEGAETAAARYLVRLIAMSAMMTGDSDQLQRLLERYFEFSPKFTAELIKPALATPRIDWPPAMPRLMAEFVDDWHGMGANEAARSFADALHASIDDPTGESAKMRDRVAHRPVALHPAGNLGPTGGYEPHSHPVRRGPHVCVDGWPRRLRSHCCRTVDQRRRCPDDQMGRWASHRCAI